MNSSVDDNLNHSEEKVHDALKPQRYVDIHCHCLPSVDDGPQTQDESLELCLALVEDGVSTVIATPHQLGRFSYCNEAAQIREKVGVLNEELKDDGVPLLVVPGADVRVDERICQLLEADKILTLADNGKYILLELPHEIFVNIEPLLVDLASLGIQAIISHPERHFVFTKEPKILVKWLAYSAHLQVTAGSLLGDFGTMAQNAAWQFLSSGWVSLVATDAHDVNGRKPCMDAAFERISIKLGKKMASLVCTENPYRVLIGQDMVRSVSARMCINETVPNNL